MKYFLNTLLFASVVLFTMGCIDEHKQKETLRKSIQQEQTSTIKGALRVAQGLALDNDEVID